MSHAKSTEQLEEHQSTAVGAVPIENGVETHQPDFDTELGLMVGLPAYNEEVGIGSVVLATQKHADEVVVVDDGSTDRTVEVARAAGATVIQHETNKGKGSAVKTLFEITGDRSPEVFVLLNASVDGTRFPYWNVSHSMGT